MTTADVAGLLHRRDAELVQAERDLREHIRRVEQVEPFSGGDDLRDLVAMRYDPNRHGPLLALVQRDVGGQWRGRVSFAYRGDEYSRGSRLLPTRALAKAWVDAYTQQPAQHWARSDHYATEWAGPSHAVDGIPRSAGMQAGQWEPPRAARVRGDIPGIDTDGRYETGRVVSYVRRWSQR